MPTADQLNAQVATVQMFSYGLKKIISLNFGHNTLIQLAVTYFYLFDYLRCIFCTKSSKIQGVVTLKDAIKEA